MLCSGLALRGSVWFTIRVTFLSSDTRNSLFQKGKSATPPCKEQSFAPLVKGKSFAPPCKGGRGDFQQCSKGVILISLENEPSQKFQAVTQKVMEDTASG